MFSSSGLDPGWNVSRVMVKDMQNGDIYYFLLDSWLQVYPDDEDDETCLERTVSVASKTVSLMRHKITSSNLLSCNVFWSISNTVQR